MCVPPPQHTWAKWPREMCRPKLGYTRLWNPNTYKQESWVGITPQVPSFHLLTLGKGTPKLCKWGDSHLPELCMVMLQRKQGSPRRRSDPPAPVPAF